MNPVETVNNFRALGESLGNTISTSLFGQEATQFAITARESLSPFDTPVERRDIKEYLEDGVVNGAGIIIGVLFLLVGAYLLYAEFKK